MVGDSLSSTCHQRLVSTAVDEINRSKNTRVNELTLLIALVNAASMRCCASPVVTMILLNDYNVKPVLDETVQTNRRNCTYRVVGSFESLDRFVRVYCNLP